MLPLRDAFFVPEDAVELRAFTHGLMPRTVPGMMDRFVEDWRRYGVDAWNEVPNHWRPGSGERVGWWSLPEYLGDAFIAPLLQAPPGTCIMQPNVHWTVQCLLSAQELFRERREVLVTAAEFPSVLHSVQQWSTLRDVRVRILPQSQDGFVDQEAVLDAIGTDTELVMLSHVGFTTGEKLPDTFLRAVADRVHEHGGLLAVDGYHATGSVVVNVPALEADIYFGGLLKEACGSSGNAYVYIRPEVELTPYTMGWFGEADPFGFHPTPAPHTTVRRRFLGGTLAVASLYHAVEGVRLLLEVGLTDVRAYSLELTSRCIEHIDAAGLPLRSPRDPDRRGAMVILEVEAADRLCRYLKTRNIYTDSRQGRYLRLAPFVWNTTEEIDRAFDVIEETLDSGTYLTATAEQGSETGPVT